MKITKTYEGDKIVTKMVHDNGEVDTLVFSPNEGGKNRYLLNGVSVTGVTTILNKESKPMLVDWAAKMAYQDAKTKSKSEIERILETKDYAHKKKSGEAMDIGTIAHAWVEEYAKAHINNTPLPKTPDDKAIHDIVQPFVDWCNGRVPARTKKNSYDKNSIAVAPMDSVKFLQSEQTVVSKKYWYSGTYDLLIEINGRKYLADFKTSSGIYGKSYFYQCAAYWNGWNEMWYDNDIAGSVVIRCGKEGNDLEVVCSYTPEQDFRGFKACLALYKLGDIEINDDELGL